MGDRPIADRVIWADVAKGVCILLVVVWHVVMKHYLQIDWGVSVPIPGAWGALMEQLLPLRMPLFFTISGMFAAGAVHRPWPVLARSKVAKFGYLYALWLLIHTAVLTLVPGFDTARADSVAELLEQLTISPSNLWYLLALAVYFAIAKAVRTLPALVVLAPALLLSVASSAGLLELAGNRGGLYQNLFFFLAGLYLLPYVRQLAERANLGRLVLLTIGYAAVMAAIAATGARAWPGVWPAASILATVLGVTAAAQLSRWTPVARALAGLGRVTLPVYIMHMPLLALAHLALVPLLTAGLDARLMALLAIFEPLPLTALVVGLCLLLHGALTRLGATWLFDLPAVRQSGRHQVGRRTG